MTGAATAGAPGARGVPPGDWRTGGGVLALTLGVDTAGPRGAGWGSSCAATGAKASTSGVSSLPARAISRSTDMAVSAGRDDL